MTLKDTDVYGFPRALDIRQRRWFEIHLAISFKKVMEYACFSRENIHFSTILYRPFITLHWIIPKGFVCVCVCVLGIMKSNNEAGIKSEKILYPDPMTAQSKSVQ